MAFPKVSVLMNCLNGGRYLREAFDSVFAQTYKDWEIIFWDNASTDNSVEIARSYGDRVRVFNSVSTQVLGRARNFAVNEARGKYIAFLDCDDIWLPQKLEKQMALFEKDPTLGLVFSDVFLFNKRGTIRQMYKKFKPPRGKIFGELLKKYFLVIVSVVLRKSAVPSGQWFDERLSFLEEFCLFYRVAYTHNAAYVDEPLAQYRIHPRSGSFKKYSLVAHERELILNSWLKEFPDLVKNFFKELEVYNNKTLQHKALSRWLEGKPLDARKIIKSINCSNILKVGLYMVTFCSPKLLFPLVHLNHLLRNWFD